MYVPALHNLLFQVKKEEILGEIEGGGEEEERREVKGKREKERRNK